MLLFLSRHLVLLLNLQLLNLSLSLVLPWLSSVLPRNSFPVHLVCRTIYHEHVYRRIPRPLDRRYDDFFSRPCINFTGSSPPCFVPASGFVRGSAQSCRPVGAAFPPRLLSRVFVPRLFCPLSVLLFLLLFLVVPFLNSTVVSRGRSRNDVTDRCGKKILKANTKKLIWGGGGGVQPCTSH